MSELTREGGRRAGIPLIVAGPCALLFALAVTYSYVIPLGYGPDEPRHYAFVRLLWVEHKLCRVLPDGRELGNAIALHPPTYYLIEGVLWYPAHWLGEAVKGRLGGGLLRALVVGAEPARVPDDLLVEAVAYRLMRLSSAIWGAGTLALALGALRCIWPRRPRLVLGAGLVMALWPHLLMNFATITNDCGANLAGALFVWYWASRAPRGPGDLRHAAKVGALVALAGLMKVQVMAALLPVGVIGLVWGHGRRFWARPLLWRQLVTMGGVILLLAGPWYARNVWLYGRINYVPQGYSIIPPGMTVVDAVLTGLLPSAFLATVSGLFRSVWAQVGWFPEVIAPVVYALLLVASGLAAIGLALVWRRWRREGLAIEGHRGRAIVCLVGPWVAIVLLSFYAALFVHFGWHEGGRYQLFALPGLAALLVRGWLALADRDVVIAAPVALLAALNVVSIYNLITYLNPTYGTTVLIGQ